MPCATLALAREGMEWRADRGRSPMTNGSRRHPARNQFELDGLPGGVAATRTTIEVGSIDTYPFSGGYVFAWHAQIHKIHQQLLNIELWAKHIRDSRAETPMSLRSLSPGASLPSTDDSTLIDMLLVGELLLTWK